MVEGVVEGIVQIANDTPLAAYSLAGTIVAKAIDALLFASVVGAGVLLVTGVERNYKWLRVR